MTQIAMGVITKKMFALCKFDLIHFCFSKQFGESCQPFAQLHVSVLTSVVILQLWKLPQSKAWNLDDWPVIWNHGFRPKGTKLMRLPQPLPLPLPLPLLARPKALPGLALSSDTAAMLTLLQLQLWRRTLLKAKQLPSLQ